MKLSTVQSWNELKEVSELTPASGMVRTLRHLSFLSCRHGIQLAGREPDDATSELTKLKTSRRLRVGEAETAQAAKEKEITARVDTRILISGMKVSWSE